MEAKFVARDDPVNTDVAAGPDRFERVLNAADQVRESLDQASLLLDSRIEAAERTKRALTVGLSLAALAAALVVVWLTRQLEQHAESLREMKSDSVSAPKICAR